MAVLKRSVKMVSGLSASLVALQTADKIAKERLDVVQGDANTEGSISNGVKNANTYTDKVMAAFKNNDFAKLEDLVNTINGGSDVEGSFRKAVQDVIGSAPETLDTLNELAKAIKDDKDFAGTITKLISDKYAELKGYVDNNKMDMAANLGDLKDKKAARDNMNVFDKGEVQTLVTAASAYPVIDVVTVVGNDVELTNAPKNGFIMNFSTARYVDENGVAYDIQITKDTSDSKKDDPKAYVLLPDESKQFDGKTVMVQYFITK